MKFQLLTFAFLATVTASAQNSCLSQASNQDLLSELAARLGGANSGGSAISVIYSCDSGNYLDAQLYVNLQAKGSLHTYIGNTERCTAQTLRLNGRKNSFALSGGLFALCDNSGYLDTYTVSSSGIARTDHKYLGDTGRCDTQAEAVNSLR